MRKLVSVLASGALIAASLALPSAAVAASPATITTMAPSLVAETDIKKISQKPKIVSGKTTVKKGWRYAQTIKLPVLENSTSKNRKAFKAHAKSLTEITLMKFNTARVGYCKSGEIATFDVSPAYSSVYKKRYASVSIEFDMYLCGATVLSEMKSFTLDLKTGKTVGIEKFVDQDDITTKVAVSQKFHWDDELELCLRALRPDAKPGKLGYIPRPSAWVVSSKGIRFHFAKYAIGSGACGLPSGILPWDQVATAKDMTGPVKNRIYANQLKYNTKTKSYSGWFKATSMQGQKFTFFESWAGYRPLEKSACTQGVRTGKVAKVGHIAGASEGLYRLKLTSSSANPKLHFSKPDIADGWREATAKDLKIIKKLTGTTVTARKVCGS